MAKGTRTKTPTKTNIKVKSNKKQKTISIEPTLVISGIPPFASHADLNNLLGRYGNFHSLSVKKYKNRPSKATVVYAQRKSAKQCVEQLNGADFEGFIVDIQVRGSLESPKVKTTKKPKQKRVPMKPKPGSQKDRNAKKAKKAKKENKTDIKVKDKKVVKKAKKVIKKTKKAVKKTPPKPVLTEKQVKAKLSSYFKQEK
ncbi:hypothetical protein PCE1_003272 [Barthelona sp. PCE]